MNLFKIPLWMRSRSSAVKNASSNFEAGLLANMLRQNKNMSHEEFDQACEVTSKEMAFLRNQLQNSRPEDQYDIMVAALRRIENAM